MSCWLGWVPLTVDACNAGSTIQWSVGYKIDGSLRKNLSMTFSRNVDYLIIILFWNENFSTSVSVYIIKLASFHWTAISEYHNENMQIADIL